MRLLIDSHALIWWWNGSFGLPEIVRDTLADRRNTVFVSAATAWEISTKYRSGRLPSLALRIDRFSESVVEDGFQHLDVRMDHGVKGGLLEGEHKDPFDRILAAQALMEDLTVITRDREIAAFGCKVLWQ